VLEITAKEYARRKIYRILYSWNFFPWRRYRCTYNLWRTPGASCCTDRRESRHVFANVENRCSLSDLRTNLTSNFVEDILRDVRANQSICIESFISLLTIVFCTNFYYLTIKYM